MTQGRASPRGAVPRGRLHRHDAYGDEPSGHLLGLFWSRHPEATGVEWFVDLYGGYSWTERADVEVKGFDILGVPIGLELLDVDPDGSPLVGVRAGYWFEFAPELGLALDAFYFHPDIRAQRVRAQASVTVPTSLTGELFDGPVDVERHGAD